LPANLTHQQSRGHLLTHFAFTLAFFIHTWPPLDLAAHATPASVDTTHGFELGAGVGHQPWYSASKHLRHFFACADQISIQAVTKRAGRKKDAGGSKAAGGQPQSQFAKKAVFETTKKKEVGVSDLTLISKISNEAINDNLKKRFENGEIYVRRPAPASPALHRYAEIYGDSD